MTADRVMLARFALAGLLCPGVAGWGGAAATPQGDAPGAAPPGAEAPVPPAEESLRVIEDRGRLVADHFEAWAQAETLLAAQRNVAPPDTGIVLKGVDGLRVIFVKDAVRTGNKKELLEIAESSYDPTSRQAIGVSVFVPPSRATATLGSYTRALQIVEEAARGRLAPPLDHAVIREKDGSFSVYLRARAADGPGGDLRGVVAPSGRKLVEVEPLHEAVTSLPPGAHTAGEATLHAHVKDEPPTATDVALVVRRPDLAPHLVLTPHWMFRIDAEGRITYLGPNPVPAPAPVPGAARESDSPAVPVGGRR